MTTASDLLQRHFQTLVEDNAQWQTLITDDVVWQRHYVPAIGRPAQLSGREEVVVTSPGLSGPWKIFAFYYLKVHAFTDPEAALAEVKAERIIKPTGQSIFRITCCSCERQAALHRLSGYDGHRLATSTRSRVNFLRFDMPSDTELLERLDDRFNARDIKAALATMHPDVIWANGLEGGHVHGHDGVRDYWTRQWAMMDSCAGPTGFSIGEDGTVYVEVHPSARDLHGNALFDEKASHVFQIEDGLIRRFDIRK